MKIQFIIDWESIDWGQYEPLLFGGQAQINEAKLSTLPADFSVWATGALIVLPVKITQNGNFTDIDVIGEVTEVLYINTVSSPYYVRVTIKMLKPYEL